MPSPGVPGAAQLERITLAIVRKRRGADTRAVIEQCEVSARAAGLEADRYGRGERGNAQIAGVKRGPGKTQMNAAHHIANQSRLLRPDCRRRMHQAPLSIDRHAGRCYAIPKNGTSGRSKVIFRLVHKTQGPR